MPDVGQVPAGFGWEDLLAGLVETHGSLAAVATRLAEARGHAEDLESIERGLRRLRDRGGRDGGVWGRRVLAAFGLPASVEARVRWMGVYHGRLTDLPRPLAADLLRVWDRPPVSEAPARVWIALAWATLAVRDRDLDEATARLDAAGRAVVDDAARVECLLTEAFVASRRAPEAFVSLLDEAEAALDRLDARGLASDAEDRLCWRARLVDHRAFRLNAPRPDGRRDAEAARALYAALPDAGAPPFARCRRANGLAWSLYFLGDPDGAVREARASVEHAGDAGSLRLRAMALLALARFLAGTEEGATAKARADAIARRLDDEVLRWRVSRA